MIEGEGGHGADGALEDRQVQQSLSVRRQGFRLRPQHVVTAHEEADGHAAKADEGGGEAADQGPVASRPVRLPGPDGLGVGLGAQDPKEQGEPRAQVFHDAPGGQAHKLAF